MKYLTVILLLFVVSCDNQQPVIMTNHPAQIEGHWKEQYFEDDSTKVQSHANSPVTGYNKEGNQYSVVAGQVPDTVILDWFEPDKFRYPNNVADAAVDPNVRLITNEILLVDSDTMKMKVTGVKIGKDDLVRTFVYSRE